MPKILVVDDEQLIRKVIKEYAEFDGFEVDEATDGVDAVAMAKNTDYDAIVMDVMMPKMDGFTACREILKRKRVPILMLSARGEEYDKLFGFEMGVDDYVVKPFSPKELQARLRVIIQRNAPHEPEDKVSFEGLTIDFAGREVFVDGRRAEMTPKEYELLFYMVRNKNIALSREKLLTDVWGYDFLGDDRTVDTHVKMLRYSLGAYRKFIVTLRGVGYKFETAS